MHFHVIVTRLQINPDLMLLSAKNNNKCPLCLFHIMLHMQLSIDSSNIKRLTVLTAAYFYSYWYSVLQWV